MRVDAVVLAAGLSSRMKQNKLLLPFKETTIIRHTVETILRSNIDNVIIIIGKDEDEIRFELENLDVKFMYNERYKKGQSTSVVLGVQASYDSDGIMFFMGDQPMIKSSIIDDMIETFKVMDETILVPYCHDKRGNPVLFNKKWYKELLKVTGDHGGRFIIENNLNHVKKYYLEDELFFKDVDTIEKYNDLLNAIKITG